jgi:hypothetical protein
MASVKLVYFISYDLKDASNEYARIIAALKDLGYTRDTSVGEDTLPKNFYAGQKTISYNREEDSLEGVIEKQLNKFEKEVIGIMDTEAKGKLNKLFVSVSQKKATALRVWPK